MASVFLSYDHDDASRAAIIADALDAHGHTVWWDRQLHGGAEFSNEIEQAVHRADAVVVLWSGHSVNSPWVRDEAAEGRDAGKLIPVLVASVKPPMGFRQFQSIDFVDWGGGKRIPQIGQLLAAIDRIAATRPTGMAVDEQLGKDVPSVAVKTPVPPLVSRRRVIGAGAATAAIAGGGALWWAARDPNSARIEAALGNAEAAVREGTADARIAASMQQVVVLRPTDAKAWGLLSLVQSMQAQGGDPGDAARTVQAASASAARALALDRQEPHALLAMFALEGSTLDWITRDRRLRRIIALDPGSTIAVADLVLLMQATGYWSESWTWNERALALMPLSADFLSKRALKLWIFGRVFEADKVIDQVRALDPANPWAWWARFVILAFSGRPQAAQEMLASDPTMVGRPDLARIWRPTLEAFDKKSAATIAVARKACIEGAKISGDLAGQAAMILCALGDVDTAFAVTDGLLLSRGSILQRQQADSKSAAIEAGSRISTQWLFTPPTAAMRSDPRFAALSDATGLSAYWRARGVRPDFLRA